MTDENYSFEQFMKDVNMWIGKISGMTWLSTDDLDDYLYRDAYDSEVSPKETARDALDNDDLFALFFGSDE